MTAVITKGPPCRQSSETRPACQSRKIRELRAEGMSQDQAVATALSMCERRCKHQEVVQLVAEIEKVQEDQQLVFGWLYVARKADGEQVVDHSREVVSPATLEKASYKFALEFRVAKEMHEGPQIGRLVEVMVFTAEKRAALGVPDGILPDGIWVGFKIDDEDVWKRVKSGELRMFSFGGRAIRRALEDGNATS